MITEISNDRPEHELNVEDLDGTFPPRNLALSDYNVGRIYGTTLRVSERKTRRPHDFDSRGYPRQSRIGRGSAYYTYDDKDNLCYAIVCGTTQLHGGIGTQRFLDPQVNIGKKGLREPIRAGAKVGMATHEAGKGSRKAAKPMVVTKRKNIKEKKTSLGESLGGDPKGLVTRGGKKAEPKASQTDKTVKKRKISEIPRLSSESESGSTEEEENARETAVVRKIEAFDTAALTALELSKEIIKAVRKGGKAVGKIEVGAWCQKYEEASALLDGARKTAGEETMETVEAIRL